MTNAHNYIIGRESKTFNDINKRCKTTYTTVLQIWKDISNHLFLPWKNTGTNIIYYDIIYHMAAVILYVNEIFWTKNIFMSFELVTELYLSDRRIHSSWDNEFLKNKRLWSVFLISKRLWSWSSWIYRIDLGHKTLLYCRYTIFIKKLVKSIILKISLILIRDPGTLNVLYNKINLLLYCAHIDTHVGLMELKDNENFNLSQVPIAFKISGFNVICW